MQKKRGHALRVATFLSKNKGKWVKSTTILFGELLEESEGIHSENSAEHLGQGGHDREKSSLHKARGRGKGRRCIERSSIQSGHDLPGGIEVDARGRWRPLVAATREDVCSGEQGSEEGQGTIQESCRGPPKQWLETKIRETKAQPQTGVWKPALLFAFSSMWMLRETELAIVMKEDIQIQEEDRITSLYLRARRLQENTTALAIAPLRTRPFAISKELLDSLTIEDDHVAKMTTGQAATKEDVVKAWRKLYGMKVTGHSARRSGALQYIRRSWRAPQVAYLGRWKSNVILQFAEEALATMPVMPRNDRRNWQAQQEGNTSPATPSRPIAYVEKEAKVDPIEVKAMWEENAKKLQQEVRALKAARDKLVTVGGTMGQDRRSELRTIATSGDFKVRPGT